MVYVFRWGVSVCVCVCVCVCARAHVEYCIMQFVVDSSS